MNDYCTTPEERHEVAERLRHLTPSKQVHPDYTPWYTDICAAIGGKRDPWFGISALAERLTDLIDPTCKLKIQDGHACCGNCGHVLAGEYEAEEDYWCFRPYCPDCGAKVVSKDD